MDNYVNYIAIAIIGLIIVGIVLYLVRAKRRGQTCIGCPASGKCNKCSCGCGSSKKDDINNAK